MGDLKRKTKTTSTNVILYKKKDLQPFLTIFVLPLVGDRSRYSLRNSDQFQTLEYKS